MNCLNSYEPKKVAEYLIADTKPLGYKKYNKWKLKKFINFYENNWLEPWTTRAYLWNNNVISLVLVYCK